MLAHDLGMKRTGSERQCPQWTSIVLCMAAWPQTLTHSVDLPERPFLVSSFPSPNWVSKTHFPWLSHPSAFFCTERPGPFPTFELLEAILTQSWVWLIPVVEGQGTDAFLIRTPQSWLKCSLQSPPPPRDRGLVSVCALKVWGSVSHLRPEFTDLEVEP